MDLESLSSRIGRESELCFDAPATNKYYEDAKGFVVCEKSQLAIDETPSLHNLMSTLRRDLIEQGIVIEEGQYLVFAQDQIFSSPSTAAGVLGRPSNGRTEWKTKNGLTLKKIQSMATEPG